MLRAHKDIKDIKVLQEVVLKVLLVLKEMLVHKDLQETQVLKEIRALLVHKVHKVQMERLVLTVHKVLQELKVIKETLVMMRVYQCPLVHQVVLMQGTYGLIRILVFLLLTIMMVIVISGLKYQQDLKVILEHRVLKVIKEPQVLKVLKDCLLYTSDAADDMRV